MLALLTLLIIILLSILITRIASEALVLTGLDRDIAKFQARSAFSGVGFATGEAETVVIHPVRRKIILALMLLGNAGLVTAVSSLILGFVSQDGGFSLLYKAAFLVVGLVLLYWFSSSRWAERGMDRLIQILLRRYTNLEARDYANLLGLTKDYRISELKVKSGDWLEGKSLAEAGLRKEGIMVLGDRRMSGLYLGAPKGETVIEPGDMLVLYGRASTLDSLCSRPSGYLGDLTHQKEVDEQSKVSSEEGSADSG